MSTVTEALVRLADWALTLWPWSTKDETDGKPMPPPADRPPGEQAPTSVPPVGRKPEP